MGLMKRLKRITLGRIEAFLERVERPEAVFPQLVRELAVKVGEAVNAEAKALTAVRGARRRTDESRGKALRLAEGARTALAAGDEATARRALAAQLDAEVELEARAKACETAEAALAEATRVREQLQSELERLKARKTEILARVRAARVREEKLEPRRGAVVEREPTPAGTDVLDAVARMEARLDEMEAEADIRDELDREPPAVGPEQ